jgi:hypothetical protein
MRGLALCELYFTEVGLPMLQAKFPTHMDRIAAGLIGDGSECFGFDDDISHDHDWGPSFCLWLTQPDYELLGAALQEEVIKLPMDFAGFKARQESEWGGGRVGVFEIGSFFKRFIGFDHVPRNLQEWRVIPETHLAVATNGKVFADPVGELTDFRTKLKAHYPEDIRLKKMAARCMSIAQTGQYNYVRCAYRGEWVAAHLTEAQFISDIISMVFLLNKAYRPFYKWLHRAVKTLPILGETIYTRIQDLVGMNVLDINSKIFQKKIKLMEDACQLVINALREQGISDSDSKYLLDHGPSVQSRIQDPQIGNLNVWVE